MLALALAIHSCIFCCLPLSILHQSCWSEGLKRPLLRRLNPAPFFMDCLEGALDTEEEEEEGEEEEDIAGEILS